MTHLRYVLLVAGTIGLQGCPPPSRPPAPDPVSARGFLPRDRLAPRLGAYGFVVLTAGPSDASRGRYLRVCDAYLRHLQPLDRYPETALETVMVTFWVLRVNALPDAELLTDCRFLLDAYDYERAEVLAAATGVLESPGPLLIASNEPFDRRRTHDRSVVILDLTDVSDEDLERTFQVWQVRVAGDARAWSGGFNLVRLRAALQDLIDTYGSQILRYSGSR